MVLGIIRKATKVVDKLAHTLGSTRYIYIIRCNKGYTTNGINGMVKKKGKKIHKIHKVVYFVYFLTERIIRLRRFGCYGSGKKNVPRIP